MGSKTKLANPLQLPPLLTKQQVAAVLNIATWSIDQYRRDEPTFPRPTWISDGRRHWVPADIESCIKRRKRGDVAPAWKHQHQKRRCGRRDGQ